MLRKIALLLLASSPAIAAGPALLGGRIKGDLGPLSFGIPAQVRLYSANACVGWSNAVDGWYSVSVQPGTYWMQVVMDGRELSVQRVTVSAGQSADKTVLIPLPITEAPKVAKAKANAAPNQLAGL